MKNKYLILYFIGLLAIFSCQQDTFDELIVQSKEVRVGDQVKMDFSLVTSDFSAVTTRMTTEQENEWSNVWVAQFNSDSILVGTPRSYPRNASEIAITALQGNNILYFITNVDQNPFVTAQGSNVSNMKELHECVYTIENPNYFDTATKIVMVGVWEGAILPEMMNGDSSELILNEIVVYAKRLTSKISLIVEATLPNVNFQNKKIVVEKIQLCAVPLKVNYMPGSCPTSGDDFRDFAAETFTEPESGGYTYTPQPYYVLENMQGTAEDNEGGAPMKGNYAPKDGDKELATHVKIRAFVEDGVNSGYVDYRVYLGKNAETNFDLERNFHYTITIKIQGIGPEDIHTDVRIESTDDLHQLQLQTHTGARATSRQSEIRYIDADKEFWGWDGEVPSNPTSSDNLDFLKVYSNEDTWELDALTISTTPGNPAYQWNNLYLQYNVSPTGGEWVKVELGEGLPLVAIPSGARIRLHTGVNNSAYERAATIRIKLHGVENSVTREWRVGQHRGTNAFNIPVRSYFPGEAGTYAVAVRSSGATAWKYDSRLKSDNVIQFVGTVGTDGFSDDMDKWQEGHGAILFKTTARGNLSNTGSNAHRITDTLTIAYKASIEETEVVKATTILAQLATAEQMLTTLNTTNRRRFAFEYSSDPLFTTIVGFSVNNNTTWAMNMLAGDNTNYDDNKGLVGTTSAVTGKENTLQIFNKLDRKAAEALASVPTTANVTGTPIFTPAGICMSMNREYWDITSADDDRFEWYLPSRNEALMDVFVSMLGLENAGNGIRSTIWSSTVPASTIRTNSAYFAGMGVDISAVYSTSSAVRCIRRKKDSEVSALTYPYLKNDRNTPIIVVREDDKGFVDRYRAKPTITPAERYYHIGYPERYTYPNYAPAVDGTGPISTVDLSLSPIFQVAKQDASSAMLWYVASGWNDNLDFNYLADPPTGCRNYTETIDGVEYNDWRLPTEMELRLIGLLGGGMTQRDEQKYILQKGGVNFTDIPGFVRMNGNYWTGTEYISANESKERANYVTISDFGNTNFPLRGSAANRTTNSYRVRCVRDIR